VNAIALRIASSCAACLVAASAFAAGESGSASAARKGADASAVQGGGAGRASPTIALEEDSEGNEVPPPAPSGEERRAIGDHIRDHTREVNGCYEKRLQERKGLRGKMIARFDIGPNGRVIGATADGMDDRELSLCVVKVVRAWTFVRPHSSAKLRVAYPWVFPLPSSP
jgi:outer membrane biosynthesis protein TonB